MRITLKQLNLFISVAKWENITKGSEAIFLSQPAATLALKELEAQLGKPLFDRVGKKLVLNKNGLHLFPKAVELIERTSQIEHLFDAQGTLSGTLNIGTSSTIGNYVMPKLIAQFTEKFPQVKIIQSVGNTEDIIEELEKFKLDIGFIEGHYHADNLEGHNWKTDELIIFSSPSHPLAQKSNLTKKDLQEAAWILREKGSGTREILENHYRPDNVILEIGSTQAIKKIVMENIGISCASRYALSTELEKKELVELKVKNLQLNRHFIQLMHKDKYSTDLINAFLNDLV